MQRNVEQLKRVAIWLAECHCGGSWCAHRVGKEAVDGLYGPMTVFNSPELFISCTFGRAAWTHRGNVFLRGFRPRDPYLVPVHSIPRHETLEEALRVWPKQS